MSRPIEAIIYHFASTLWLVVLCSAIFLSSGTPAAAQKHDLDGTYTLDEADSDNISKAIEGGDREYELPDEAHRPREAEETKPRLPPGRHRFFFK